MNPAPTPVAAPARWPVPLAGKPDFERCMDRIDAWFAQQVLDRPPLRFYKHNAQYETGEPLDRARWPTLEARWFDVEYQLEELRALARRPELSGRDVPRLLAQFRAGRVLGSLRWTPRVCRGDVLV